jgi:glycerol-3-phosphate dehydrogenase
MTTERKSLKARIPAAIFNGLTTFRGMAAVVITAAALFSTVGAAQLSDVDELDDALPCHKLAGVLAVDDCAHFNTLARKYNSSVENALNSVGYVGNVQGEIQASGAYLAVRELNNAELLTELQAEMTAHLEELLNRQSKLAEALSNMVRQASATQAQLIENLK